MCNACALAQQKGAVVVAGIARRGHYTGPNRGDGEGGLEGVFFVMAFVFLHRKHTPSRPPAPVPTKGELMSLIWCRRHVFGLLRRLARWRATLSWRLS